MAALIPILLTLFLASIGTAGAGAAQRVTAQKVTVSASDHKGRVVTFKPRGVDAGAVERGVVRSSGKVKRLPSGAVDKAVDKGRLEVRVSPRAYGQLRAAKRDGEASATRRWLRRQLLVLKTMPQPTEFAPMLISPEQLAALPTSGAAYDYMKQQADAALESMNLGPTPDSTSPWLPNYNGAGSVRRPGVQTLAAALVYARTGETAYRDLVVRANRYLIGSEDSASTDGTNASDKTLATARSIGSYVLAADLVGMDRSLTGSRAGYTATTWQSWLASLRTKTIGEPANCNSLVECSNERAHNWGAFATGARISIDIHLGDSQDLAVAVGKLKQFLGESTAGAEWLPTRDLDLSFACVSTATAFTAINPASCGPDKDGMIVEDISRSAGAFPSYDSSGIGYTLESYQALLFSAILLERQGYEAFNWGDQALRRVMDWLTREGKPQGNGSGVERHLSWIPQHFYAKSYATVPAGMGRTLGFTDWLFAS